MEISILGRSLGRLGLGLLAVSLGSSLGCGSPGEPSKTNKSTQPPDSSTQSAAGNAIAAADSTAPSKAEPQRKAQPAADLGNDGTADPAAKGTQALPAEAAAQGGPAWKPSQENLAISWADRLTLPWSDHQVIYLQGDPVGFQTRSVSASKSLGEGMLRWEQSGRIRLQRGEQLVDQSWKLFSLERPDGAVLNLAAEWEAGGQRRVGELVNDKEGHFQLNKRTGDQTQSESQVWPEGARGPFSVEQSFLRRVPELLEARQFVSFDPVEMQFVPQRIEGMGVVQTATLDGNNRSLHEVRVISGNEAKGLETVHWVDDEGILWKSYIRGYNLRYFRATAEQTEAVADQLQWESVPLPSTLAAKPKGQVTGSNVVRYTMKMKGQDPFRSFVRGGNQSVQSISAFSAVVTVQRQGSAGEATASPTPSDAAPSEPSMLGSNRWMATDQPDLQTACRAWLGSQPHTVETAMARLAEGIAGKLQRDPVGKTLISSSRLMRAERADCFGHAVLLATAARACRIPARVALGLAPQSTIDRPAEAASQGIDGTDGEGLGNSFGLHAWVEAWDGKRWQAYDSCFRAPDATLSRIKLGLLSFDSENPYRDLLEASDVLSRLTIDSIDAN
ncbi:MAG: transglutaminase-like domain-containing protein [Pirellulaceae bacterium]